jgi:hypothetical protein
MLLVAALSEDIVYAALKSCSVIVPFRSFIGRTHGIDASPEFRRTGNEVVRGDACYRAYIDMNQRS